MRLRFALVSLVVACSPATPNPEIGKPINTLPTEAGASLGFDSPASWSLTFANRWRPAATLSLDSGSTLLVGDGGERWIESAAGETEGAASLAPEQLVGMQKTGEGFRFVGASGTVYGAREALGPLHPESHGVTGARHVAVGKRAILVVDDKGDLQRSIDGGRTWNKIAVGGNEGVVVDVAMQDEGGILVTAPQRFYGTKDDGATWAVAKSPGIGVQQVIARDGALWVEGIDDTMRFDPAWGTFQSGSQGHAGRQISAIRRATTTSVERIDGRRAVRISGDAKERAWSIAVGEGGTLGKLRKLDELDGCESVDFATRGEDIVVACDARGTLAGGIDKDAGAPIAPYFMSGKYRHAAVQGDGGSLGWITRILKSSDGGRTFHEDTTIEGGLPQRGDTNIAIGAEDFVYLGRRCGVGYGSACLPARVRASKSAGFSEVPNTDTDGDGEVRFATNGAQSLTYSIGVHDNEAFLFRWRSGSAVREPIGRIAASIDAQSASITLDDDGTVRGFVRAGVTPMMFTYREGGTLATAPLGIPATRAAFAEKHGFAIASEHGQTQAFESLNAGVTWGAVAAPAFVTNVESCSTYGCQTDRGVRWGWDAPPPTPGGGAVANVVASYARPLRCSAKDRWIPIGGGNLPRIGDVDHGTARWVLPTRDKNGKLALVLSKRGEPTTKTTSVALMGTPPGPPTFGSGTVVHVQPGGAVAVRYVYKRARTGLGRYNPVDAEIAWYRDASGRTFRQTVSKNPPFRVSRDPQDGYDREANPARTESPEVVALGSKGVFFRPPNGIISDESGGDPKRVPLMLLRDDGKIEKIKFPESGDDVSGSTYVATIDGTTTLLEKNPESFAAIAMPDGKRTYFSVLGGLSDDDGAVDLIDLGGKPAFAATLRDPARAWILGIKSDPDLGPASAIATQKSLGDVPKACDGAMSSDPNAYRVDAPYVLGSRRPVIVDADGTAIILATDRAEIRGEIGKPDACVAAFDAMTPSQDGDADYGALVFADDLGHSLLFRAETATWPATISVRTMECQYQAGPLPQELDDVEGFKPDARHSAVRKRY
ncbi:MAG TPA: hypothetical protein VGH28_33360 [Polyangiaceae bacterium]|jgi:hypothetical protein